MPQDIIPIKNVQIFISYSDTDRNKMRSLEKIIKKYGLLKAIIVADNRQTLKNLDEKVIHGILTCDYFIPILTTNSIKAQWINQEIGFAKAKDKKIYPIAENQIIHDLKGFIHNKCDLSYRFDSSTNKRSENFRFNLVSKTLINDILIDSDLYDSQMTINNTINGLKDYLDSYNEFKNTFNTLIESGWMNSFLTSKYLERISLSNDDTPISRCWTISEKTFPNEPVFNKFSDEIVGNFFSIKGSSRFALDYDVKPDSRKATTIEWLIKPQSDFSPYLHIMVTSDNGALITDRWLNLSIKNTEIRPLDREKPYEYLYPMTITEQNDGWKTYKVNVSEAFNNTFGRDGWDYFYLIGLRIRGQSYIKSITIS